MKKKDEIIAECENTDENITAAESENNTQKAEDALNVEMPEIAGADEIAILEEAKDELKIAVEAASGDNVKIFSFDTVRTALILLLVTGFTVLLLAFVNYFTKEPIAAHRKNELDNSVAAMFPNSEYTQITDVKLPDEVSEIYLIHTAENEPCGFLVIAKPTGFGGEMELMVGTDLEGTVSGVKIISDAETATKIAPIKAEGFLDEQYASKKAPFDFTKNGGTVEIVSGSTVSSEAILKGVNNACDAVNAYLDSLRKEQAK